MAIPDSQEIERMAALGLRYDMGWTLSRPTRRGLDRQVDRLSMSQYILDILVSIPLEDIPRWLVTTDTVPWNSLFSSGYVDELWLQDVAKVFLSNRLNQSI